jgi:hypothetical protein
VLGLKSGVLVGVWVGVGVLVGLNVGVRTVSVYWWGYYEVSASPLV